MNEDRREKRLDREVDSWRLRVRDDNDRKVIDQVFDRPAMIALSKLISDGKLDTIDYPVSTGKEGSVFHATAPDGRALALKVYRVTNATFRALSQYIVGDPRFKRSGRSHRGMIEAWAMKEFRNLERMRTAGARVPAAVTFHRNILLMDYLGDDSGPAPVIRTVALEDPEAVFEDLRESLRAIRKAELVHGDLSEYNILFWEGHPWVIDVGQSVPLEHGLAEDWHRRDMENIARYFRRLGVAVTAAELDAEVRR